MFTRAITRKPGPNFGDGITTSGLGRPDYDMMLAQHREYIQALESLGLAVDVLEPLPDYPDAYFVEDVAVVIPELAVITRPGAPARQGEEPAIEAALARYRPLAHILAPGTLEGGDVMMAGRHFFIGISIRTNRAGAEQLGSFLAQHGYTWTPVAVEVGLHLKTSANYIGQNTLLVRAGFAGRPEFGDYQKIVVDAGEERAANTLLINEHLVTPAGFPRTRARLEALGYPIIEVQASESRKMDGGLSCMSLRL